MSQILGKIVFTLVYNMPVTDRSFWNFAQNTATVEPCPVRNIKAKTRFLKWVFCHHEASVQNDTSSFNTQLKNIWVDGDFHSDIPDSKVRGANMGPTWILSAPDGPHVGPMNLNIRDSTCQQPVPPDCAQWSVAGNLHINKATRRMTLKLCVLMGPLLLTGINWDYGMAM